MSKPITLYWTCENCEEHFCVEAVPVTPARTYGPPESCSPEEGGEYEPTECPTCEHSIPAEGVAEKLAAHFDSVEEQRHQDYEK